MNRNTMAVSGIFLIAATLGITLLYEPVESETDNVELSNFQSEQDFIDYMSGDRGEAYSSGSQRMDAETSSDASGSSGTSSSDAPQRAGSTQEAEWIQTRENRILISHRYPRHFNSVEIPGLDLEHNVSDAGGPMVTSDNLTVVEEQERIVAYDREMNEEWELGLESYVEEMTRSGDQLILLTRETDSQCPIRPFDGAEIACTSVLRPGYMGQNDYTYTVSRIDIETGEEQESKSFVASSTAQVEVTSEKTYISYSDRKPEHEIMANFLLNEASVSSETRDRVEELQGYDLTDRSMQIEIEAAIRAHENEDMKELEEEFSEYDEENMRSYEDSILMTVNNSDFSHEEQSFDGRISGIETGGETLLTVEYNGVDYENRVKEIRLLGGESTEMEGEAQLFNDSILVREDEEIRLLDSEMNEINSVEIQALNVETSKNRVLASVRPEDVKETERENRVVLFDSELERLDSETIDSWSLYSFNLVEGEETSYSLVHGYNSTYLMEIGEEIDLYETEASGQLLYQEGLYTVGEKVQKLSETGEVEEELDLKIPRNYVPLPEPMPR